MKEKNVKHIVIDASALAAVMLAEEGSAAIQARISGATLHAPELLRFELASAALKKARKHPAQAVEILGALAAVLHSLRRIQWHDVQMTDVAVLARTTGLSIYDASYMWLAGWLEAELLTLDERLARAREPQDNRAV